MTQPTRRIDYSRFTHDYSCYIQDQYVGSAPSYTDGEILIDRILVDRAAHHSFANQMIAGLAQQYQRAKMEGRLEDAAEIKKAAMVAKAAELGIEYSVFEAEYTARQAQKAA